MKKIFLIVPLLMLLGRVSVGNDGKVETVKEVLLRDCKMKVSDEEALRYVRDLFLVCIPRSKVTIKDNCVVRCLKPNPGVVVGR